MSKSYRIGVLGLQGAFREHLEQINTLGHVGIRVTTKEHLEDIDALILPGGESTTMGLLLDTFDLKKSLVKKISSGFPIWGTCAGMILLANRLHEDSKTHLKLMDIEVKRNAYGRQLGSFQIEKTIPQVSDKPIPLVFIRAPYITQVGPSVEILAKHEGYSIAARENNLLVTSFHPELTEDTSFLKYFISFI